jgi:hypothetical protein
MLLDSKENGEKIEETHDGQDWSGKEVNFK